MKLSNSNNLFFQHLNKDLKVRDPSKMLSKIIISKLLLM